MRVGILGTGDVGKALGKGFITLGNEVKMGSREGKSENAVIWAKEMGAKASVGTFSDQDRRGARVFSSCPACSLELAARERLCASMSIRTRSQPIGRGTTPYTVKFPARLDEIPRFTVASGSLQARSTPCCSGTIVALQINMSTTFPVIVATSCPVCGRPVEPAPDSTWVIAWYSCRRCGHEWSARIRNGRPDISAGSEVFVHSPAHNERT